MVLLIHRGQHFGFTLNEIRKVLALFAVPDDATGTTPYQKGDHACVAEILRIGAGKLGDLNHQMELLQRKHKELSMALNELERSITASRNDTTSTD